MMSNFAPISIQNEIDATLRPKDGDFAITLNCERLWAGVLRSLCVSGSTLSTGPKQDLCCPLYQSGNKGGHGDRVRPKRNGRVDGIIVLL